MKGKKKVGGGGVGCHCEHDCTSATTVWSPQYQVSINGQVSAIAVTAGGVSATVGYYRHTYEKCLSLSHLYSICTSTICKTLPDKWQHEADSYNIRRHVFAQKHKHVNTIFLGKWWKTFTQMRLPEDRDSPAQPTLKRQTTCENVRFYGWLFKEYRVTLWITGFVKPLQSVRMQAKRWAKEREKRN